MNKNKIIAALLVFFCYGNITQGQIHYMMDSLYKIGVCDQDGYCIPSLQGLPRPKGIEINYAALNNYRINTEFKDSDTRLSDFIERNERYEFKLRVPVVMKPELSGYVGFKYSVEEFEFSEPDNLSPEFHGALEDRALRSIGTKLTLIKPFKGQHYLIGRAGVRFSGDFNSGKLLDYMRSTVTVLYGKKPSADKTWGMGLSFGYTFGRPTILPVFAFSKQFTDKFHFQCLLPINARLGYQFNEKNILYVQGKMQGDKYYIDLFEDATEDVFIEKTEFIGNFVYEREIHDFLWVKGSFGATYNFQFNLTESSNFLERTDPDIINDLGSAFRFEFGIFVVPPKKWMD